MQFQEDFATFLSIFLLFSLLMYFKANGRHVFLSRFSKYAFLKLKAFIFINYNIIFMLNKIGNTSLNSPTMHSIFMIDCIANIFLN